MTCDPFKSTASYGPVTAGTWTPAASPMPTRHAKAEIRELANALAIDAETRRLAAAVHGVYVLRHDVRDPDRATAVAAVGIACQLHEVPLSINDIARRAGVDPADGERAYHELCEKLSYTVCDDSA